MRYRGYTFFSDDTLKVTTPPVTRARTSVPPSSMLPRFPETASYSQAFPISAKHWRKVTTATRTKEVKIPNENVHRVGESCANHHHYPSLIASGG
jgi:hypothetical protein